MTSSWRFPPLCPNMLACHLFWWNWFQPAWEEGLVFIPDKLIIPFSAPISNFGKLPHLISRGVFINCQIAFLSSTRFLCSPFNNFFFLNFRLYLFAFEVHPFNLGISMSLRSGLSSLIVKFLIFIFFFSGLGIVSWYHSFLKTTYFSSSISDCTYNQLNHPHYLSTSSKSHFWSLSKVLFPEFQFYTSRQLYLAAQLFV